MMAPLKPGKEKGITALMPPSNTQITPAPPPVEDYQVSKSLKIEQPLSCCLMSVLQGRTTKKAAFISSYISSYPRTFSGTQMCVFRCNVI